MRYDEIPELLGRLIQADEARVSAQITMFFALTEAGFDTAEALLQDYRRALPILRRQWWAIPAKRRSTP